jgi:hypothetical protein
VNTDRPGQNQVDVRVYRYRISAICFFMAASALLVTSAILYTLADDDRVGDILGWTGVVCLAIAGICELRHAAMNRSQRAAFLLNVRRPLEGIVVPAGAPAADELGGPPPRCLDTEWMLKNFLGKTADEAFEMFRREPVTEDFAYMQPAGLIYYLPPALRYLESAGAKGDWEFAHGLLCSLSCQVTISNVREPAVLQWINRIADYLDLHRTKFDFSDGDLVEEYLRDIRGIGG